jgi:hypothetical protein
MVALDDVVDLASVHTVLFTEDIGQTFIHFDDD